MSHDASHITFCLMPHSISQVGSARLSGYMSFISIRNVLNVSYIMNYRMLCHVLAGDLNLAITCTLLVFVFSVFFCYCFFKLLSFTHPSVFSFLYLLFISAMPIPCRVVENDPLYSARFGIKTFHKLRITGKKMWERTCVWPPKKYFKLQKPCNLGHQ